MKFWKQTLEQFQLNKKEFKKKEKKKKKLLNIIQKKPKKKLNIKQNKSNLYLKYIANILY